MVSASERFLRLDWAYLHGIGRRFIGDADALENYRSFLAVIQSIARVLVLSNTGSPDGSAQLGFS